MDLNLLKYVIATDKNQSISKAADELYVSQPNISKAIQIVEKEIGFPIFTRTSRGVTTTNEGKAFIKKAIKLVKVFDDFAEEFTNKNISPFSLNVAHQKIVYLEDKFEELSHHFQKDEYLNINLQEKDEDEIIDLLLKDKIKLGILCINENDLPYFKRLLQLNNINFNVKNTLKIKVITHASNQLGTNNIINKNDLNSYTVIASDKNDYYYYYEEKHQINTSSNILKTNGGIGKLSLLASIPNSYILSLPLSDTTLQSYGCKMLSFDNIVNDWVILTIYKKYDLLTDLEKKFVSIL
ncbi:MAG: LysR family transcriptional regulator [Bacilli bacterium]|nr:LysR family transcriptional regulator [Bacilli bacterium]